MSGNLKSVHPLYKWITGSGGVISVINIAANRLIRMFPERLPELPAAWTIGPTVANETEITMLADMIVVYNVVCAHKATTPDWDTDETFPMGKVTFEEFDLLDKSATGYPNKWARRGKQLFIHPVPTAAYIDHIRVYGLMEETFLVNASDVFYINAAWHPVICKIGASMIAEMRDRPERAKELIASARFEVENSRDLVAEENLGNLETVTVTGTPTRSTVYGR